MDKLPAATQQQLKRMSDDRLRTKLVDAGYAEDLVATWERDELLARYAEVIVAGPVGLGARPKEPKVIEEPEAVKPEEMFEVEEVEEERKVVVQDLEWQKFEFERMRWEREKEMENKRMELEIRRIEEREKEREKERELEARKMEEKEKDRQHELQLERQKMEFEEKQRQADREEKLVEKELEQKRHDETLKLQKKRDEEKNDVAAKIKKYSDAMRGSMFPMGSDPLEAPAFFEKAEQIFRDAEIPKEFQAKVISPLLSAKARAILSKVSVDITKDYDSMKTTILRELQLSPNVYLERFNLCTKVVDETFTAFSSKLRNLLDYYLKSRGVTDFATLCELLVCDRIKSTLSEGCLKYVLSIESGKEDRNWMSVSDLVGAVDRFIASRGDAAKPRAYALGQTPKQLRFTGGGNAAGQGGNPATPPGQPKIPSNVGNQSTQKDGNFQQTPLKSVACYYCGKTGHVRRNCAQFLKDNGPSGGSPGSGRRGGRGPRFNVHRVAAVDPPQPNCNSDGQDGNNGNNAPQARTTTNDSEDQATSNVNHVTVHDCQVNDVINDVSSDSSKSVSLCNNRVQLSELNYTDVKVSANDDDGGVVVRALVDSGAQISVVSTDLFPTQKPETMGTIKLQPFCGDPVSAEWVRLSIQAKSDPEVTKVHTIDCAMVSQLNESMIITSDVLSMLTRDVNDALIADVVVCNETETTDVLVTCNDDDDDDCDVGCAPDPVSDDSAGPTTITNDLLSQGSTLEGSEASREQVAQEQREDETLKGCYKLAKENKGGFVLRDGLLYRKKVISGERIEQLVVPKSRRIHVLDIGHNKFGGHMAEKKTRDRIELTFFWPTIKDDCHQYVSTCGTCQLKKRKTKFDRVPITPIPRCDRVFDHMFMDVAGPFVSGDGPKPKFNYALVVIDSYSRFPFCTPLKTLQAKHVCEALIDIWSVTGVCSHLSSDLGKNFISHLTQEFERQLGCSPHFNSPYHPQATGLVERCVGSVKSIIGKLAVDFGRQWHVYLPCTLWALREAVNATTGLSPWTLVFGRLPTGPLAILKNHWVGTEMLPVSFGKSATEYLQDVQKRLEIAEQYAGPHAEIEQRKYQHYHNLRSTDKHFEIGEDVLVLVPNDTSSKLFSRWIKGKVTAVRSPYSYLVHVDGVDRHYHANHLRKLHLRVESVVYDASVFDDPAVSDGPSVNPINSCAVIYDEDQDFGDIQSIPLDLNPSQPHELPSQKVDLESISHLSRLQQTELLNLLDEFHDCFSEIPGFTDVYTHKVELLDGFKPKRLPAYRVPERLKPEVSRQIQEMLDNEIIRPSESPMASPLVCVMKGRDGCEGVRLAIDYRYVNKYTQSDTYPMNNLQSIFQSVSRSNLISVCDMKGAYWQVKCQDSDCWLTAFVCDDGVFEFTRCPFGMKNSGTSFIRAVSQILSPVREVAKSFVDDVAVHSGHWREHMVDLRRFLEVIRKSGLTLNLKKCK